MSRRRCGGCGERAGTLAELTASPFPIPGGLETPAVVIDLDVVERNIAAMASAMAERAVSLRPHVKTHKSVRLARMQLEAGAMGITVGTLGEAEVMADAGIDDLFVAYPVWADGMRAARVRSLHERTRLRVGIDSEAGAMALAAAVRGSTRPLEVLVEVDSGLHRTGAADAHAALAVAAVAREVGLDVIGAFTHGGHGYASPERARAAAADEIAALAGAGRALESAGFEVRVLSAGSTPTALHSAAEGVTEERPGTYVFGDRLQLALGTAAPDSIGLAVATTVVSASRGSIVIDAGAKVLAREPSPLLDGLAEIAELGGATVQRAYDYHGVVALPDGVPPPPVGSVMSVVPNHVCPVVNLVDELVVARGGAEVARWRVDARGRNG